jgi:hypothetical protein
MAAGILTFFFHNLRLLFMPVLKTGTGKTDKKHRKKQ